MNCKVCGRLLQVGTIHVACQEEVEARSAREFDRGQQQKPLRPLEPLLPGETRSEYLDRLERADAGNDAQQLVARIKRSSKYYGQTKPNEWFAVRVVPDMGYGLRGNNNNYRFGDVVFGVRLGDGTVVDLSLARSG